MRGTPPFNHHPGGVSRSTINTPPLLMTRQEHGNGGGLGHGRPSMADLRKERARKHRTPGRAPGLEPERVRTRRRSGCSWRTKSPDPPPSSRFSIALPSDRRLRTVPTCDTEPRGLVRSHNAKGPRCCSLGVHLEARRVPRGCARGASWRCSRLPVGSVSRCACVSHPQ